MCVAHSRNRDSLLWITVLKPSWLTEQWVRQETEEQGALFFVRQCVFGAAPANKPPSVYEFSLSSWLSPGRPGLLAEECMGVGFFNKGNSLFLEAPRKPWALLFMVSLLCSSKVGYLLVLLLFKHNGFTLRLGQKDREMERKLKSWLISCMPMLNFKCHDILLFLSVVLSFIQIHTFSHIL